MTLREARLKREEVRAQRDADQKNATTKYVQDHIHLFYEKTEAFIQGCIAGNLGGLVIQIDGEVFHPGCFSVDQEHVKDCLDKPSYMGLAVIDSLMRNKYGAKLVSYEFCFAEV